MLVRPAHARPAHGDGALAVTLEVVLHVDDQVQCSPRERCVLWHDGVALGLLSAGCHGLDPKLIPFVGPALAGEAPSRLVFVTAEGATVKLGGKLSGIPDAESGRSLDAQMLAEVGVEVGDPLKMVKAAGGEAHAVLPFVERQLQQTLEGAVFELAASGIPAANIQNCHDALLEKLQGVAQLEAWGVRAVAIELLKLVFAQQTSPESAPGATAIADPLDVLGPPAAEPPPVGMPLGPPPQAGWSGGPLPHAVTANEMAMGVGTPAPAPAPRSRSRAPMIVATVFGLLLVAVVVVGAHLYNEMQNDEPTSTRKPNPKKAKRVKWRGRSTYRCSKGNKKISNIKASFSEGVAIQASGSCRLSLINVSIEAPVVIQARNDAQVYVIGGAITGTTHSIEVAGDARVTMKKAARLRGALNKTGNGRVLRTK